MPAHHCIPHTEEAKAKMSAARLGKPTIWKDLPRVEIAYRLLNSSATTRSIADEYGCSASTVKLILKQFTTKEEREEAKRIKSANSKRGKPNVKFANWRKANNVWIGRKHRPESKEKQSAKKKGVPHSFSVRVAKSARLQNVGINEWKGFASSETERMKKSLEYKHWRKSVFSRDNWTCQGCGQRGGTLHAHHIKPKSIYPELTFDVSNGQTLCRRCHQKTDTYGLQCRGTKPKVFEDDARQSPEAISFRRLEEP